MTNTRSISGGGLCACVNSEMGGTGGSKMYLETMEGRTVQESRFTTIQRSY